MDDDCPPSYEDYMNEVRAMNRTGEHHDPGSDERNQANRQKEYWVFLRINFTVLDIGCSFVAVMAYLLYVVMLNFFEVRMMNVKQFCDQPEYHHNRTETVGYIFASATAGVVVLLICATTFLAFSWGCRDWRKLFIKTIRKIWVVAAGYFFVYMYALMLQKSFGTPTPHFFSNQQLYDHYCRGNDAKYDSELDKELRMSFPSTLMALECFSSAFLVFYIDHFDVGLGPHTIQLVMIGSLGAKCVFDGIALYENHEHHPLDIVIGALIGTASAAFTVRNLKGTVLRDTSSMPKYITNGILFDYIGKLFQNVCSFRFNWRPTRRNVRLHGYGFPEGANYSFRDPSTSTETEPRVPRLAEYESEPEPDAETEV